MNTCHSQNSRVLIDSVVEALSQGEALLGEISDAAFVRKHPAAFGSSIGGHYRHCLDHFRSLLESAQQGDLNYDHRERGTVVETDRFAALNLTRQLREGYEHLQAPVLARPLTVTCKTSYASKDSEFAGSTVGRELMYAVAHAVHHYALIGIMASLMELQLPPGFGVAPSTLKHQSEVHTTS